MLAWLINGFFVYLFGIVLIFALSSEQTIKQYFHSKETVDSKRDDSSINLFAVLVWPAYVCRYLREILNNRRDGA